MKKKILKISFLFIFAIIFLSINKVENANSINSISMDIYVDKNGDAQITEVWNCYTNEGTEVYHPYYNLGNSKITNLRVNENNNNYNQLSEWDTTGTLSFKANKCGIHQINNGVELCWGMSSYGQHTYTVKYNLSNFVSELADSQMIYWTLIPYDFSNQIGNVRIKIYTDSYIQDTIDVWGFGKYGGLCYVSNGAIYMSSEGAVASNEYMTILSKFPKGTFNASNLLDYNFEHFYQMAQEGSIQYNHMNSAEKSPVEEIIEYIIGLLIMFSPWIIIVVIKNKTKDDKFGFKYGKFIKKIPKDVAYYRDIPCNGDIFRAYYIAYQYGLVKKKTDILGAIILKWLKEGIIKIENRQTGKYLDKKDTVIILGGGSNKVLGDYRETQLFHMLHVASKDGILENREFDIWCKKSYRMILGWFDDILEEQRNNLVKDKLIVLEKNSRSKKYFATQELKDEAIKIAGLRRFLLNYTLIGEREAIEVELFENYLIYAQMLGIAKQVSKQFKQLFPDMIEQTNYGSYESLRFIDHYSSSAMYSANSARMAAENYSSGGGGFSSGGGGGGSFGGGGGRRWFSLMD